MSQNDNSPEIIVFQGPSSQTGLAFKEEFKEVSFDNSELSFDEIRTQLLTQLKIAALPVWNSHVGEITYSNALKMVFSEEAFIYHLWPAKIVFECLYREGDKLGNDLISVSVVKQQCSQFIQKHAFSFVDGKSTVQAYKKFNEDKNIRAVLCAPGTNIHGHKVLESDAANPLNFTTFGILATYDSNMWTKNEWQEFYDKIHPVSLKFSAIQMPIVNSLSDAQEILFDSFIEDAKSSDDIPKILFVSRYEESKCRLLIQGSTDIVPEIITEAGADEDIKIIPNVGSTKEEYSKKAFELIMDMKNIDEKDFIENIGENTCFYACPALGILMHGFEKELTALIFRHLIKKHFELLSKLGTADNPSNAERIYLKYKDKYQKSGMDFIEYSTI